MFFYVNLHLQIPCQYRRKVIQCSYYHGSMFKLAEKGEKTDF